MASIGSIMTFGMNKILIGFTSTAAAVFGVYFKLQSFIFMPVFGLNNGMVPIIGFNYGARKPDRLMKTMRLAVTYAVSIMIIGMILFWTFTPQLLAIFNASAQMLSIGIPALRIISLSFLLAGFDIIIISVMQALGHGVISDYFHSASACGTAARGIHFLQNLGIERSVDCIPSGRMCRSGGYDSVLAEGIP